MIDIEEDELGRKNYRINIINQLIEEIRALSNNQLTIEPFVKLKSSAHINDKCEIRERLVEKYIYADTISSNDEDNILNIFENLITKLDYMDKKKNQTDIYELIEILENYNAILKELKDIEDMEKVYHKMFIDYKKNMKIDILNPKTEYYMSDVVDECYWHITYMKGLIGQNVNSNKIPFEFYIYNYLKNLINELKNIYGNKFEVFSDGQKLELYRILYKNSRDALKFK